jgi:hypothetical protein
MKKALITTFIAIVLSAGIFFSAGNLNVSASETENHIYIESLQVSGTDIFFEVETTDVDKVILEYSYYKETILFSRLVRLNVQKVSINTTTGLSKYHFSKPNNALSMKIWRIANDSTIRSTVNGEYIYSEATALSQVQARVKQIIVDNDLITKERIYSDSLAAKNYRFVMHFDLVDEEGVPIDIDRIIRLGAKFNVIQTGLISSTTTKNLIIEETTFYPQSYFPFFVPERITQNIDQSFDTNYTWMVDLGSFTAGPHIPFIAPADITLEKTQLLTIDYVFEGVFYNDQVVIDEPYDSEDIIDVIPGTTDPATGLWDRLDELFGNLENSIKTIIIIVVGLGVILVLSLLFKTFSLVKNIFIGLWKIIKFIVIEIPKALVSFIKFLFIPRSNRKERENVNRYF